MSNHLYNTTSYLTGKLERCFVVQILIVVCMCLLLDGLGWRGLLSLGRARSPGIHVCSVCLVGHSALDAGVLSFIVRQGGLRNVMFHAKTVWL